MQIHNQNAFNIRSRHDPPQLEFTGDYVGPGEVWHTVTNSKVKIHWSEGSHKTTLNSIEISIVNLEE